ncbi:MAG TPA: O-antigen ligase family protein [Bryobacteraceae bacterium]|nr:O-antigen ligase family protein [Bryobacteraceae bacterium]
MPFINSRLRFNQAAFYLTFGSAVSIVFSIAVSQILMGLAVVALLMSGDKFRLPPIKLPLALFIALTIIAVLASGDPRAGSPQIRKFFVFLILLLVCSTFRTLNQIRALVLLWSAGGLVSAALAILQFLHKYRESIQMKDNSYTFYISYRITGLASHWMTFSGQVMIVMLMLAAFLCFAPDRKWKPYGWAALGVMALGIVLSFTRSVFLFAAPLGLAWLAWNWKRRLLLIAPVAALLVFVTSPPLLQQRVLSVFEPKGPLDSNQFRAVCRATGWQMIKAHPLLGLGPEEIAPHFDQYIPKDTPRPLPAGWYGHLHNVYLQYAAERGIPALLVMLWLIGKVLYDFARALRRPENAAAKWVLQGAIAVILAVLAEGFFEYNLGDSEVLTLFLVTVGCGYVAINTGTYPVYTAPQPQPQYSQPAAV